MKTALKYSVCCSHHLVNLLHILNITKISSIKFGDMKISIHTKKIQFWTKVELWVHMLLFFSSKEKLLNASEKSRKLNKLQDLATKISIYIWDLYLYANFHKFKQNQKNESLLPVECLWMSLNLTWVWKGGGASLYGLL
jgi:hypothetical protein